MADSKITGLTADTSPTSDDLVTTVNDPTGTPGNRQVTLDNLRLGLGTAWTDFTPSYQNFTAGNCTSVAKYTRYGRFIVFYIAVKWGNTTSASGAILFSLPVTAATLTETGGIEPCGVLIVNDSGANQYSGVIKLNSTTIGQLQYQTVSGSNVLVQTNVTSTAPITFSTSDGWYGRGFYEAAS